MNSQNAKMADASSARCPFRELPEARVIRRSKSAIVIRDAFPVSPGHTLVSPVRHIACLWDASLEEQAGLLEGLFRVRESLAAERHPDGFNIAINDGTAAGQTVMHLHIHLIPRYWGNQTDPRAAYVRSSRRRRRTG